jgi:hypothetical protein
LLVEGLPFVRGFLVPPPCHRYALKEVNIPEAVNIVLRLMLKHGFTPDDIDELKREEPP